MLIPLFDRQPTHRPPLLTVALIVMNVGIFWWWSTLPLDRQLDVVTEYGLVPGRLTSVESGKPLPVEVPVPNVGVFQTKLSTAAWPVYRSTLTMMFLHGSWLHVIGNMWMLWIFGNNIEDRLGHVVFLGFFLLGGLLSAGCQWLIDPESVRPVVGASGAVWAVMGGYAVTYPKARVFSILFVGLPIPLNVPALVLIALWFFFDLAAALLMLQGALVAPVAYWAHVGGCVAGVVLVPVLGLGVSPADADWRGEAEEQLPTPAARFEPRTMSAPPDR